MNSLITAEVNMTSLELAEVTGKKHKNIMRDIRSELDALAGINELIFEPVEYKDAKGEKRPMYNMGRKGAMQLALKYDAVTRYKVIQRIEELENAAKVPMSPELQAIFMIDQKQTKLETRMVLLENTSVIDHRQQLELQRYAKAKVIKMLGGSDSPAYEDESIRRRTFQGMWKDFKDFMQVASYKDTPKVELQKGKEYIDQWAPSGKIVRAIMTANG